MIRKHLKRALIKVLESQSHDFILKDLCLLIEREQKNKVRHGRTVKEGWI